MNAPGLTSPDDDEITVDTLYRERVTLLQPARGYRASVDPVLLAAFVRPPFGRFADIGCGTGAVAFSLAARDQAASGVAIELQPRLAGLARRGLDRNAFASRLTIVEGDVRRLVEGAAVGRACFDLVVSNPPFRPLAGGFASPDEEIARAHHEVTLTLGECLDAAAALRHPAGRVAFVFLASRTAELLSGLMARGLQPRRLRFVHPTLDKPASRVLVEAGAAAGARPCEVEAPLALRGPDGHSDEMRHVLGEA